MNRPLLYAVIAFFVMTTYCFGLTPQPKPHTHSIKSENGLFYARVDVRKDKVTVKKVRRWWFDKSLWSMQGYLEWASVADDGSFIFSSWHLVSPPFSKEKEVLWIYLPNGLRRTITLGQIVRDTSTLEPVLDFGSWGGASTKPLGDWIKIKTCEDRTLYLNAKTGTIQSKAPGG